MAEDKSGKSIFDKERAEKMLGEIKKGTDELVKLAKGAKEKFDKADDKTKMQIFAGIAGATALIASIIGIKKLRKKIKK